MIRREPGLLGTTRDQDALLAALNSAYWTLDEAVTSGALVRTKITNQWLYAPSAGALTAGLEAVEAEAIRRIRPWLLGAAQWIRGPIARASTGPSVTAAAVELLLRQLARERRLGVLGLLTTGYEPYLGLYAPEDTDEISRQVRAMGGQLRERGYLRSRDLPAPEESRKKQGWRSMILRHGEFLGIGRLEDGVLMSWEQRSAS